ncbi:Hypothetical protein RG1141_CH13430 [Neorhizobium galegae bv. officinalis bv. officinalis str. HAMBI 1141]|uniref:DUF2087 domain-containing protein n=1 Tax=Neorhizobium galegae bv. officinalis bv. officinalis str. HAMBI 1141 TaxID=1028801 RepID=A0A068T5C5_NEOGA|nr:MULTISPECIES: DUF2087 domain-containing protein [Neorhizobium]MCJ9752543.1 DUF2087 domain-containing protein [Neorhizobium sp. BETTINA12A]CDN53693.1 Hypothetical protein RG1141_CH13430 [Neorhizobium galegae bv. officinalis bv. officinalis str. HAMBI 1141]
MPRSIFPMEIADLSAFAKSVRDGIARFDHKPSHLEMLNLLTRAAGFRNYQHFRAVAKTADVIAEWRPVLEDTPAPDEARVLKTARHFDEEGRLVRWPGKRGLQEICLWFLWSKIPADREFTERQISELLNTLHLFGDAAMLRRDLFDFGLVQRTRDGREYRRIEKKPPAELKLLLSRLGLARATAA